VLLFVDGDSKGGSRKAAHKCSKLCVELNPNVGVP